MGTFVKGDVVVVPFPFSDLTQAKRRPALVLAQLNKNDLILCQITSQFSNDDYTIQPGSKIVILKQEVSIESVTLSLIEFLLQMRK